MKGKKDPVAGRSTMWQEYMDRDSPESQPYFVYTPESYRPGKAVPLLIMLHGCTQTPADFAAGTRMNELAERYGFIVAYPQQERRFNRTLCWNWYKPSNQVRGGEEPGKIARIVQAIQQNTSQWTIDSNRIYVAGASAGAAMAVILGATYPDIFAAIGVHSGVEYQAATNAVSSLKTMLRGGPNPLKQGEKAFAAMGSHKRPVRTIVFQGTRDRVVAPVNGDLVVQQWMQTDHLASQGLYSADFQHPDTVTNGQVPKGHAYTVSTWKDSAGNAMQEYWKINGMGHAWSGGSPEGSYTDPKGPDASEAMYQFFTSNSTGPVEHEEVSLWRKIRERLPNPLHLLKIKRGE